MEYTLILIAVLVFSPFVLSLASNQKKAAKLNLKYFFILILASQVILGFLNWENFTKGRSGFELSLAYPDSLLGLFFIISALQILALLTYKSFITPTVILNFINTILVFTAMIKLSSILGFQAVSFASIGVVFLVLYGNIAGLAFINKDKKLLAKYPYSK